MWEPRRQLQDPIGLWASQMFVTGYVDDSRPIRRGMWTDAAASHRMNRDLQVPPKDLAPKSTVSDVLGLPPRGDPVSVSVHGGF